MKDQKRTQVTDKTMASTQRQDLAKEPPHVASEKFCEDQIRDLAHQKWQAAGRPECEGVEFWLEAERDLAAQAIPNDA